LRWWKGKVHQQAKIFREVPFLKNETVVWHHLHLQELLFLVRSVVRYQAIFFFVFLHHVFLLIDNTKFDRELLLMTSSVEAAVNFSSFPAFVYQFPHS
jgi:hypothetical protein